MTIGSLIEIEEKQEKEGTQEALGTNNEYSHTFTMVWLKYINDLNYLLKTMQEQSSLFGFERALSSTGNLRYFGWVFF